MNKRASFYLLGVLAAAALACTTVTTLLTPPTATLIPPTPNRTATVQAKAARQTQLALDVHATYAEKFAQETITAGTATQAAVATSVELTKNVIHTGTAAAQIERTKAVARIDRILEYLYQDGFIATKEGSYYTLPDYEEVLADPGYYQWEPTRREPYNFVVRADLEWADSSEFSQDRGGCGFLFRFIDRDNHYAAYYSFDGHVGMFREFEGEWANLGYDYLGDIDPPYGEVEFTLVVEGEYFHIFIDNLHVHTSHDAALQAGNLAYVIFAGSDATIGTRCAMTNVDLWVLK